MNILVVDFSYIMYEVIRVYKDKVDINENSTLVWRNLEENYGLDARFIKYDARAYKNIAKLIASAPEGIDYIVTSSISDIAKEMARSEDMFNIINIDYFDDMAPIHKASNKVNDLNWISYLENKNKIESYRWISTCTSEVHREYSENTSIDRNLDVDMNSIDKIILVSSPHFVPYEYKTLFDVLEIILESKQIVEASEESIEGE